MSDEWRDEAACRSEDRSVFFPERFSGRSGIVYVESTDAIKAAKAVCATCPVMVDCLAHAMAVPERFGVWGGRSAKEREKMRKSRRAS